MAVAVVLAAGRGVAAADKAGPALDLTVGIAVPPGTGQESGVYARVGAGVQVGRVAGLVHGELFTLTPRDETLDSESLHGSGLGAALRVDLQRRPGYFIQAQAGFAWRDLDGSGEVRRACSVFGSCVAGFYLEQPDYQDFAPYVAIGVGVRGKSRIWPGFGMQLGIGDMTIDRPGTGPDEHGAMIWLATQFVIGTGN